MDHNLQSNESGSGVPAPVSAPAPPPPPPPPPPPLPAPKQKQLAPMGCHHNHFHGGRNVIVCIDGTSNQFGQKASNTNVVELYNLILKAPQHNQRTWYNSGIGTFAQSTQEKYGSKVLSKLDSAFAMTFERTILSAYQWLCDTYLPGDSIFLFGFSRGAYQVRVLSAMIDKVGLLHKGNQLQIPFAFDIYKDPKSEINGKADRFKHCFSQKGVKVHFVGVWDTVSSVGFRRGLHNFPKTIEGMEHVCYFRHALALDERRVKFLPEYVYGGSTTPPPNQASKVRKDHTLEVWFAGTHSDIGGGNVYNARADRSRPPLRWMVSQAAAVGLRAEPFPRQLQTHEQVQVKESLTLSWWIVEMLPVTRLSFSRDKWNEITRRAHLGSSRKIHVGQKIHSSFIYGQQVDPNYVPKARPPPSEGGDIAFWDRLRKDVTDCMWLEHDLSDVAFLLEELVEQDKPNVRAILERIALTSLGRQALRDRALQSLEEGVSYTDNRNTIIRSCSTYQYKLLRLVLDIINKVSGQALTSKKDTPNDAARLKNDTPNKVFTTLKALLDDGNDEERQVVQRFLGQFTGPRIKILLGASSPVLCVSCSPHGWRIASGTEDGLIYVWDTKAGTGKPGELKLERHHQAVLSIAFSHDGKFIVSGSADKTICLWDSYAGTLLHDPFIGHEDPITSVAFSIGGEYIASGSDTTIRIWDTKKGTQTSRIGARPVTTVAFSPDLCYLASGSVDGTITIWKATEFTYDIVREFQAHNRDVLAVAFSPDSSCLSSGSKDGLVRMWGMENADPIGEVTVSNGTGEVGAFAFSEDGEKVACAVEGETHLWDMKAGKRVGHPWKGHKHSVNSIAFSGDGERVASATKNSEDYKVRLWNANIEALKLLANARPEEGAKPVEND